MNKINLTDHMICQGTQARGQTVKKQHSIVACISDSKMNAVCGHSVWSLEMLLVSKNLPAIGERGLANHDCW